MWKSDDCIVPLRPGIQPGRAKPGNTGAGKAVRPSRELDETSPALCGMDKMFARLDRITNRAETQPDEVFNNLFTVITRELLWTAFRRLKKNKAPGVDGVTVDQYEESLDANLRDLLTR